MPEGENQPIPVREEDLERALKDITAPEIPLVPEQPVINDDTEEVTETFFTCPHCEHETEYIRTVVPTSSYDSGGSNIRNFQGIAEADFDWGNISWDHSGDNERNGDVDFECEECNDTLSWREIQEGISTRQIRVPRRTQQRRSFSVDSLAEQVLRAPRNKTRSGSIIADERHFDVYSGPNVQLRHAEDQVPDAFSPEVISHYVHKGDPYGYALMAQCTNPICEHSFMVGPEDINVVCPKCDHEFQIKPLQAPFDAQNASDRRRRFGSTFNH